MSRSSRSSSSRACRQLMLQLSLRQLLREQGELATRDQPKQQRLLLLLLQQWQHWMPQVLLAHLLTQEWLLLMLLGLG